ncbi:hypothetical protein BCV72DRAFT_187377, partial [Rhizopus microsporus var. microsporus]
KLKLSSKDAILILGGWMTGRVRYHEPIRGKGMRRMLRKEILAILLMNANRTSSLCPECEIGGLETFKFVKN